MNILDIHRPMLDKAMKRFNSSFYYYDLDGLKLHLEELSKIIDNDILLWYACKANPLSAILKIFRNLNYGIDVASKGELEQVLSAGLKSEKILSTGPAKSQKYLKELLEYDVEHIVCESINQLFWLESVSKTLKKRPTALLRLQLNWKEGTSVLGGNAITPFGEDVETWSKVDFSKIKNVDIRGLHVFQWGNILDISRLETIWRKIIEECLSLSKTIGIDLEILDLGGGLGIPYTKEDKPLKFSQVQNILLKVKEEFKLNKIWMELGRFAVGPFGSYMTQVIDRKEIRGQMILVLDGGINHMARPALTGESFPCSLYRKSSAEKKEFQVHGPLCTALDILGTFSLPSDVGPGDWLCFFQAGAYGATEAMPYFLCHNLPAEAIIYNGDLVTPRSIKSSADWLV